MDMEVERLRSQVKELQAWVLDLLAENKMLRVEREARSFDDDQSRSAQPLSPTPS